VTPAIATNESTWVAFSDLTKELLDGCREDWQSLRITPARP